jgi:hypothetical protein
MERMDVMDKEEEDGRQRAKREGPACIIAFAVRN